MHAAQRHQHRHGDDAARAQVDARALPRVAPGVTRRQLLQRRGERRGLGQRVVDIGVAEDGAAGGEALGIEIHRWILREANQHVGAHIQAAVGFIARQFMNWMAVVTLP
jgi:hypothetical protein